MGMLMETTQEQDRRALTVLARAAATRPELRVCLTELLSVLPGLSPVAVDVALGGGYPAPLAEALTTLARKPPCPPSCWKPYQQAPPRSANFPCCSQKASSRYTSDVPKHIRSPDRAAWREC